MLTGLHCVGASGNSFQVALCPQLRRSRLDRSVSYFAGCQTRDTSWRAATTAWLGPGPRGDGRRLIQSGAICAWLPSPMARTVPPAADEKFETMRWLLFDNQKFTAASLRTGSLFNDAGATTPARALPS